MKIHRAQIFRYQKEETERQLNKKITKVMCPYTKDWKNNMTFKTDKYTI